MYCQDFLKSINQASAPLLSRLMKNEGQLSRFKQRRKSFNSPLLRSTGLSGMIVAINKTQLRGDEMFTVIRSLLGNLEVLPYCHIRVLVCMQQLNK